jgi:hypothetical protein
MGVAAFGDGSPIPGMGERSIAGVQVHPSDERSREPMLSTAERSERVTERAAAKMCRVVPGMIGLWVETGAWPMPRRGCSAVATFGLSEVECWLATGTWPAGAQFRAAPRDGAPPAFLATTSRRFPSETLPIGARSSR